MFKLQTKISFFRYGSTVHTKPILVTWFKLDKNGHCFSKEELEQFSDFARSRTDNFEVLIPFDCSTNSADFIYNSAQFITTTSIPHLIVLGRNPREYKKSEVFECMDIILTNKKGLDNHNYHLDFDVLGHIEN